MTGARAAGEHVTLILPSFRSGGAERVLINLARGLAADGVPVRILVLEDGGPLRPLVPGGVEVVPLGRKRARFAVAAIVRALRDRPGRAVLTSHPQLNMLVPLLRPLLPRGTRIVVREPILPSESDERERRIRALEGVLGSADAVIASSAAMGERLAWRTGAGDRIVVVPNPVDIAGIRSAATHTAAGAPPSRPALISVGRLVARKGHADLLDALAASPRTDLSLTVVGDGPERGALKARAVSLGLATRTRFTGRIDDVSALATLVGTSDRFVHPARFEGMPNAVLEALALGTPVLATREVDALVELAQELGPSAIELVDRAALPSALESLSGDAVGPLRPSLLPHRFALPEVVSRIRAVLLGEGA